MNEQPDKLFRQNLGDLPLPAPSGAWSRIEHELDKKDRVPLFSAVAASVLVLAVTGALLWPSRNEGIATPAQSRTAHEAGPPLEQPLPGERATQRDDRRVPEPAVIAANHPKTPPGENAVLKTSPAEAEPPRLDIPYAEIISEPANEPLNADSPGHGKTSCPVAEKEGVVIVYSAKEVNEKYLDNKAPAEATHGGENPSALRKLLNKASGLKRGRSAFGDLRQRKNEILALNFRGEKRRSQNK